MMPGPGPGPHSAFLAALIRVLVDTLSLHAFRLNRVLPKDGSEPMTGPLQLNSYTDAPDTKPAAASWPRAIIYVSDGGAGAKFRGSDGTSWVNLG
jgi:hypothetical protein